MLSDDLSFKISPIRLDECLCGETRPGHFEGVALILLKLFNIVKPNIAIFGEKDFQQLIIVKQLVKDFFLDIKIIGSKSVRENNGLVLSSRNSRLNENQKKLASRIFEILQEIRNEIADYTKNIDKLLEQKKQKLIKIGFDKIDYLEIRDEKNLELVTEYNCSAKSRIFIAVYIGKIRLIDNLAL
jgi:pantoate--beta-alanine ligase